MKLPDLSKYNWTIGAFSLAGAVTMIMLAWQLFESTPARWCAIALAGSPETNSACAGILLKLLENKDHVNLGLLTIVGVSILALAAVALNVGIKVQGPGGVNVDIGSEDTKVTSGDSSVTIPTPPAGE
jgi:hypothetical protein